MTEERPELNELQPIKPMSEKQLLLWKLLETDYEEIVKQYKPRKTLWSKIKSWLRRT